MIEKITNYKILIGIVLIITLIIVIIVLVNQDKEDEATSVTTEENQANLLDALEKQELFEKIKKHIVLPSQEEPLIVRIDNAEELKKRQSFFENSQDNDILIVYQDKALIYRSDEDLLINVGPVYMDDIQPAQVQIISLDIRNGSEVVGKAGALGDELGSKDEYEIINIANASRRDYQESILVNLTDKDISALEKELGLETVNTMPPGEAASNADIVIIIGSEGEIQK